ncbi:PREDICTED: uncharacterized protein LOC105462603 [Wasmannia auropunctata]|uniref:uncharacterized protein LOC105462603 n=1 Tax=Wasmannia auropunctata TaxID=64793 RepID=UPI0005EF5B14|nr:PREDICTED: uncharacterized protein LOC105462603 [Wasmannia auropunctata]
MDKECERTQELFNRLTMVYKAPTDKRRGLVDGLGSIAKALFGTVDEKDEKLINQQLALLHDSNAAIRHTMKHQLKMVNATINHGRTVVYGRQIDMVEHFVVISALAENILRDTADTLDYLTYLKEGILHPRVTSVSQILTSLKEAATNLPQGLYFPFSLQGEDWITIEKIATMTAFCDSTNIFTILRFPLIVLPAYDVIHAILLPIHDHAESVCEMQMYTKAEKHKNCKTIFETASSVMWVKTKNSWLYSAASAETITVQCHSYPDTKESIVDTGKIKENEESENIIPNIHSIPSTSTEKMNLSTITNHSKILSNKKISSQHSQPCIDVAIKKIKTFEDGGAKAAEITNALLFMVAKDNMPLNTVEKNGFQYFLKVVAPHYKIPARKQFTELMDNKYEMLSLLIKNELSTATTITLTCDVWTEVLNTEYMN